MYAVSTPFPLWWRQHGVSLVKSRINCTANSLRSAPARVWRDWGHIWAFKRNTLRYPEHDGQDDSRSHKQVKVVHSHAGIEVTKHRCIGHVQKGMETVLKEFKKETPGLEWKANLLMQWEINAKILGHCIMEQCGKLGEKKERGFSKPIPLYLQSATPFPGISSGEFKIQTF